MTGPDFIIIGAMKCGTSTMAAQLGAQPGVFMTTPKEPNYFSDDAVFARGPDWYAGLFATAPQGAVRGEASTHYTKRPDYPETIARMQATVPDVRLVYMIRNPMTRLVSHYIHAWSEGEITRPLAEVLDDHPRLVDYGRYGWQIAPFVDAFGARAILLSSLEQMEADPQGELARIAAHVGHPGPVTWQDTLETQNVSRERVRKLPLHGLIVDNPVATALRRALVPKALRARIRDGRKLTERPVIPPAAKATLEARFAADRDVLAGFFPGAPALRLCYPFLP
jgi:hypothetical protein